MVPERMGYGGSMFTRLNAYFANVEFPAHRDELVEAARAQGADAEIIETMQRLPEREFDDVDGFIDMFERAEKMGTMHVEGGGHGLHQ